ncbi:hypothetical protein C8F04DRAFT_688068 [Mycena alexandri]|uniref:Non-specific serine/threonine protein kinase n=1 Tax=Mycena alexandri TaxID=1745969 RepID=A0AAD6TCK2_9AGAR|nr:hypothetical protein C8F04DRAFT_688068 [Mycena alexandri]
MNRQTRISSVIPQERSENAELEDYDIMEKIASGQSSTVFLVNCKRGRLRNRQLALRKSSASRSEPSDSSSTYLSLSHPCIASLFSTFSTPSARYHLLELCLGGPLSTYLEREPLSEDRLRGVLKSLIEALIYLKTQGVVHRNIRPSSVLLTTDGRVKLGGFKLASHLPPSKVSPDCFTKAPDFVAPEILTGSPYNCDADLWSVGCVAITCLSGRPPFESDSNPGTVDKILNASYALPATMSTEIQDLVVKLLEINPIRRIQPPDVLSHPFFMSNLPVLPLSPDVSQASDSILGKHALFETNSALSKSSVSSLRSSHYRHQRNSGPNKTAMDDLLNAHQRTALRRQLSTRRVVSDPLPRQEISTASLVPQRKTSQQAPRLRGRIPEDLAMETPDADRCDMNGSPLGIPVGTTRPAPFTTALLSQETHKTVHGPISVLPSHSLLVDLREGERRRGQKGTEVLVIDSQGTKIEVYSAPHLSTPCCLAEPTKRYTIEDLPSTYWRQYNDAALLVERIKQRTPKLTLHTSAAKCTLMANAPRGDIELFFGSLPPNDRKHSAGDAPRMRMRLSRGCGSLEIARHVSGARGEEWTKTVLKTTDEYPHILAADWDNLEMTERDGIAHLARFWRTCKALEQLEQEELPVLYPGASKSNSRNLSPKLSPSQTRTPPAPTPASFSSTQTLPMLNVAPRPPKLPSTQPDFFTSGLPKAPPELLAPSRKPIHTQRARSRCISDDGLSVIGNPTAAAILPTWCKENFPEDDLDGLGGITTAGWRRAQTKYIPSVGWCIRHSSRVSQGGRYKIMFFDGATLEIDVDEDWAELTSAGGQTTRHNIRDCSAKRPIAERMKVFPEFVSMFDCDT